MPRRRNAERKEEKKDAHSKHRIFMANTDENEQALRRIIDFIRLLTIMILLFHFYFACYKAFHVWGLTSSLAARVLQGVYDTALFKSALFAKLGALMLLVISLIGAKGK